MKKTEEFNNVSKEMLEGLNIPEGVVRVQMEGIRYDDQGLPVVPRVKAMPYIDRVMDPHTGEFVSVAWIESIDARGKIKYGDFKFRAEHKGIRNFDPSSVKDMEALQFIYMSDHNGSKPNRDESKKVYYTIYEPEKVAEEYTDRKLEIAEAIVLIGTMTNKQLQAFAATKGWDVQDDIRNIKKRMIAWAEADKDEFMKFASPEVMRVNTILRTANAEGIIAFNKSANAWTYKGSGDVIKKFDRSKNFDPYKAWLDWMDEDDKAHELTDDLEKAVGLGSTPTEAPKKAPAKQEEVDLAPAPAKKTTAAKKGK